MSVRNFVDILGRKLVRHKTGVSASAVPNWTYDNAIPCRYYFILKGMAEVAGVECPVRLFTFYPETP